MFDFIAFYWHFDYYLRNVQATHHISDVSHNSLTQKLIGKYCQIGEHREEIIDLERYCSLKRSLNHIRVNARCQWESVNIPSHGLLFWNEKFPG